MLVTRKHVVYMMYYTQALHVVWIKTIKTFKLIQSACANIKKVLYNSKISKFNIKMLYAK